jgi:zinc transport system substrate-binding protein
MIALDQPWRSLMPGHKAVSLLILALAGLSSCTQSLSNPISANSSSPSSSNGASPPVKTTVTNVKIVTSTLPVTDFTKAVVGDRANVTYLLSPNVGPHDYQAKPEDVRTLVEANVLVKNGLGIDKYLEGLIENANNPNLKIIDTSEGIQTISNEEVEGQAAHLDKAIAAPKLGKEAEAHGQEGEFNPHIWLDPKRAVEQVENIRDGLIAADPAGKSAYSANAKNYIQKLKALDQEIAAVLSPYAGKEFVTYHDFAPYFAQRYALKAQFLVGVPEENPAPADVQHVLDSAKDSDLRTLLTEPQAVGNPFDALAKDLKVQISSFDPMETGSPDAVKPDYYLTVMHQNLKHLQTALGSARP